MSASGWGTCLKFHFLVRMCQKDKLSTSSKTFPKNFVVADSIFCKPKHKVNIIYLYNYRKALSSLIFIKDISLIKQKLLELRKHLKHTMLVPNVTGSTEYSTECFALLCWETKWIQDLSLNPGWLILSGPLSLPNNRSHSHRCEFSGGLEKEFFSVLLTPGFRA